MSVGTLRHFYVALWALEPLDWLRTVTGLDPAAYEDHTDPARQALNELVRKKPETAVARALVESTAWRVVADLFPDRGALRAAMRPSATPEARDISDDTYTTVRDEALRRAKLAAAGCSLAEYLAITDLAAMFRPYEGMIDLSDVLPDAPDMNYELALALLVAARLARDVSDHATSEPTQPWELTTRNYLGQLYVSAAAGAGEIPERLALGVRLAYAALESDQGGPEWRVTTLPLAWDVAQQVAAGEDVAMAAMVGLRRWALDQAEAEWLARHLEGVMEAILGRRGQSTAAADRTASSYGIVAQVLGAIGLPEGPGKPAVG